MHRRLNWIRLSAMVCAVLGSGESAFAHVRDYLINQPYYTTRRGEFEVEFWNDLNLVEADNDDSYTSRHQVEFEYGLTDRWQVAYYEVYKWNRSQDFERDMFKLETKYRLAESGRWPVDTAFYLEYKNPNGHNEINSDELEGKIIFSRDFGPVNLIANLITERKINARDFWNFEYTLGASVALNTRTRLGLEFKETLGDTDAFGIRRKDHEIQLLPGIYHSFSPHVRLLVGPAIGLTRNTDDLQLKSLMEIEF